MYIHVISIYKAKGLNKHTCLIIKVQHTCTTYKFIFILCCHSSLVMYAIIIVTCICYHTESKGKDLSSLTGMYLSIAMVHISKVAVSRTVVFLVKCLFSSLLFHYTGCKLKVHVHITCTCVY